MVRMRWLALALVVCVASTAHAQAASKDTTHAKAGAMKKGAHMKGEKMEAKGDMAMAKGEKMEMKGEKMEKHAPKAGDKMEAKGEHMEKAGHKMAAKGEKMEKGKKDTSTVKKP